MMYDHEKSDPAIVAVKPTNKAGQPAAELVEPRAGAEGNVSQQSTGRAQYRETVSQALKRIRQAARQRKKEKFTALFHHVSIDHLEEAFFELKENAAPGVDGLTCRDYEQHLERNLEDLHARVHRGAYRALPSRRVYIPGLGAICQPGFSPRPEQSSKTSAVAQVDNEEKSPSWFGNPRLRPPELIAQHFAGLHKAQPLQNSNIYLRAWIRRS
jgi:hypothetical protein